MSGRWGSAVPEIPRQWRYAREFRIARPSVPEEWAAVLLRASGEAGFVPAPDERAAEPAAEPAAAKTLGQPAVAELATGLWRLRRRLSGMAKNSSPARSSDAAQDRSRATDVRRLQRQLDSLWSTLAAAGVEVQEHDDTRYDSGLDLQVLEFQQTGGLTDETVLEALRPSVYLHGRRVQTGEVVVGVPVPRDDNG